jgi:hypothetical protein
VLWRYAFSGDRQKVLSLMTPELVRICQRDYQYSCDLACVHAKLGDAGSALDWLENAVELGFLNHRTSPRSILFCRGGDPASRR